MRNKKFSVGSMVLWAMCVASVMMAGTRAAAQEVILHPFGHFNANGLNPYSSLISDYAGNLYGTTYYGGNRNVGTVFELTPAASGGWTETVLYSFGENASGPYAGLIFDTAGNLYGTTFAGGIYATGAVFELTPSSSGGWTEKVLHSFNRTSDGAYLYTGLAIDASGNLYGTTSTGAVYDYGTIFELSPAADGTWTETVLHYFDNTGNFGFHGNALTLDAAGNLYGTAADGGPYGAGTVFELTPTGNGQWSKTVLHAFNSSGNDGERPYAGVSFDASGNLYGTTYTGGSGTCVGGGCGTVFELTSTGNGKWTEKILHNFESNNDGSYPQGGVILDAVGKVYGTTTEGGAHDDGVVFELSPTGRGRWTEDLLHVFASGKDGWEPWSGLLFDASGNLYGTTVNGGVYGYGTVFEIKR